MADDRVGTRAETLARQISGSCLSSALSVPVGCLNVICFRPTVSGCSTVVRKTTPSAGFTHVLRPRAQAMCRLAERSRCQLGTDFLSHRGQDSNLRHPPPSKAHNCATGALKRLAVSVQLFSEGNAKNGAFRSQPAIQSPQKPTGRHHCSGGGVVEGVRRPSASHPMGRLVQRLKQPGGFATVRQQLHQALLL